MRSGARAGRPGAGLAAISGCLRHQPPFVAAGGAADHRLGREPGPRLAARRWSGWPGLVADLLLLDFWIYWWHRANHELPWLWRFQPSTIWTSCSTRRRRCPLPFRRGAAVGAGAGRHHLLLAVPLGVGAAVRGAGPDRRPLPPQRRPPAGPAGGGARPGDHHAGIHWVHHHAVRADTDTNYGTIFSFWDPLFRSKSRNAPLPDHADRGRRPARAAVAPPARHPVRARPLSRRRSPMSLCLWRARATT